MKTRNQSTMGMSVPFQVPSTVAEFGEAAGVGPEAAEEVVLKYALDEGMFRTVLPAFRAAFFERIESDTGVERDVVGTATKKEDGEEVEVPIYQKDGQYWKKVLAETGKEASDFEELAAEVAADVAFDLRSKPRAGKPSKEFIQRADGLASAVAAGRSTWDNIISKLVQLNPGVTIETLEDGAPDLESLARALKVDADRRSKEQLAELA